MLNKLTVLCFSPTGGTARTADLIAPVLADSVETIDLLRPVTPRTFTAEDTVLIAMPVFGGHIPGYALEQLHAFQGGNARAVTLSVFGNRDFDDALLELNDAAAAAGFRVIASAAPVAEHSMIRSIGTGRPDAQDQAELAAFAVQILAKLEKGDDSVPAVPGKRAQEDAGKKEEKAATKWTPVASDACTRCGICAAECPTGAIPADAPNTTDATRCIQCMRCTAVCPEKARALPKPVADMAGSFLTMTASKRHQNCFYL